MILKVPLIKQNNPKNCAVTCVVMIMEYFHKRFDEQNFIKKIKVDKYGYSLLDITRELINKNYKIEFGFWDEDLIKKKYFNNNQISFKDLENYSKKIHLHKILKRYLTEILEFYQKYPSLVKIEPASLQKIEVFLKRKIPVLIHIDVKSYHDQTDDSIHSILVIGKENQQYIVLDPLLGKKILPANKLLTTWQDGGGYYLVILK
jgi:hypothetical protein